MDGFGLSYIKSELHMDFIKDYLDGHRYFGYWSSSKKHGNQMKVFTKKDVIDKLDEWNGIYNCGISISTFVKGMPKILFLPFDFDSNNEREAFDDAFKLYTFLKESGYNIMLNRSGGKGYHLLLETEPKTYGKNQLKSIQKFFKEFLNLKTCDEQIFHDIRRLIRIPGTYHINGNMCYTVLEYHGGKKFDISEYAPSTKYEFTPDDFRQYDYNNGHIYHPYPCVEKYIKVEEPRQIIRFAWVIEQLTKGKTEEEMLELPLEYWIDYNPDYTLYQIRHIEENNYAHPSCELLQDMGFCLGEECPYYKKWEGTKSDE